MFNSFFKKVNHSFGRIGDGGIDLKTLHQTIHTRLHGWKESRLNSSEYSAGEAVSTSETTPEQSENRKAPVPDFWKPDDTSWPLFLRIKHNAEESRSHSGAVRNCGNPEVANENHFDPDAPPVAIPSESFHGDRLLEEIAKLPETGGTIHLPPGRIVMDRELSLGSGVRLVGTAGNTELVFESVDFGIRIVGNAEHPIVGVHLENLTIRHLGHHRFCAAVITSHSKGVSFKNVNILNPVAVGFLFSDNVADAMLVDCAVHKAGLVGYMQVRDVRNSLFNSCVATQCEQSGVFLTDLKLPSGMDPLDFNGQIDYTNRVIGNFAPYNPDDPANYNTTFMNCTFSANRKMGITTDGVGYLQVVNCIISDNDCEGITIDNGSWCCLIQNSQIRNNGWRGLQHDEELTIDYVDDSDLMSDGSSKAKLPGISFDNAAYCRVVNCSIQGNWGDGIKFVRAGYGCTVSDNIISDNNRGENNQFHFFGVLIAGAARQHEDQADFPSCYNRIENNTIIGKHYSGIHLLPGTVGNLLQNNMITGYGFADIENHTDIENTLLNNYS